MAKKALVIILLTVLVATPGLAVLPTPVTLGPVINGILGTLGSLLGIGGLAVSDSGTHAATTATAAEAAKIAKSTADALDLAKRMAQQIRNVRQGSWAEWLMLTAEDHFGHNRGWLKNSNMGAGGYGSSTYPLPNIDDLVAGMGERARLYAELKHAAAELYRGVHARALNTIGDISRTQPGASLIIKDVWASNFSLDERDHTVAGGLQRVSMASMVNAQRTDDSVKLLTSMTQMLVLEGQIKTNAEAWGFEQAKRTVTDGPGITMEVVGGMQKAFARGIQP